MRTKLKYVFIFLFFVTYVNSQNTESISGSLKKLRDKNLHDTTKISLYLSLASEYISYRNDSSFYFIEQAEELLKTRPNKNDEIDAKYLRSMVYYTTSEFEKAQWSLNQTVTLSKEAGNNEMLAKSYNLMGAIQFNLGNYTEAIRQYNNKLEISKTRGDTISIIETYYNISLINNAEGSYYKSLENNYTALGLSQKIKDSVGMMVVYEGLGISYTKINDIKKAIINLKKALQIAISHGKKYEEAGIWVDLGHVFQQNGEHEKALYYFNRGEAAARNNGDKLVQSIAMSGKAVSLMMQQKHEEAIKIFNEANLIHSAVSYRKGLAENQLHIADCKVALDKHKEAKPFALTALKEAKNLGEKKLEGDAYNTLSKILERLSNIDSAYFCFKQYVTISDTLSSLSMIRKSAELESKLEKIKIDEDRAFREKMARAEIAKEKQIKNVIFIVAGVVLVLLLFSYLNYKQKQKANVEITEKKKIIEEKNKDILDSINYSKRLQEAVLITKEEVTAILPQSVLIYLPKEIVSGDFYFIEKDEVGNTHVVLAESNKYGVPGAFISIAGNTILKQAIKEKRFSCPSQALSFLNTEMKTYLKNEERSGINLAYCIITDNKEIFFSGANLSALIVTKEKKVTELEPDTFALGVSNNAVFNIRTSKVEQGDVLILLSNGLVSQKNETSEEFGKARLIELLTQQDLTEQKIVNTYNSWKQSAEQTDDICLIGIRI